uniref:Uncharacterized protein n=1 Tax=Caenorhabditis japonica TaxID=281687 RepID=A0A8R1E8M4_CAEJA
MIQELVEMCGKVGLKRNTNKAATTRFEEVNEYVYIGKLLNHNNELEPELHRTEGAEHHGLCSTTSRTQQTAIPSFYRL